LEPALDRRLPRRRSGSLYAALPSPLVGSDSIAASAGSGQDLTVAEAHDVNTQPGQEPLLGPVLYPGLRDQMEEAINLDGQQAVGEEEIDLSPGNYLTLAEA